MILLYKSSNTKCFIDKLADIPALHISNKYILLYTVYICTKNTILDVVTIIEVFAINFVTVLKEDQA